MNFVNSYFTVAILVAVIAGVAIAVVHRRQSLATKSRMQRMMVCCGIDRAIAVHADNVLKLNMNGVRARCRNCPVTEQCDRWLDGEAIAGNSFCPNVWHFNKVANSSVTWP